MVVFLISTATIHFNHPSGKIDLFLKVKAAGAMNLIVLATEAHGTLSF
jgi:hypothetical protein